MASSRSRDSAALVGRLISPILDQYEGPDGLAGEGGSSEEYSSDDEDDLSEVDEEAPALVSQKRLQAKKVVKLPGLLSTCEKGCSALAKLPNSLLGQPRFVMDSPSRW